MYWSSRVFRPFPNFQKYPGFPRAPGIKYLANFNEAGFREGPACGLVRQGRLCIETYETWLGEEVAHQGANGLWAIAFTPATLLSQSQSNLRLTQALIDIEVGNRPNREMLLVLYNIPELPSVAHHVIALK